MSKTITIDGSSITFNDDLSYKEYLEQQDYFFLQQDPATTNGLSIFAAEFSELQPNTNYISVKRSLHNATIGLETGTLLSVDHLIDNKYDLVKSDLYTSHKMIKRDFQQGYERAFRDLKKSVCQMKKELYLLLAVLGLFIVFCIFLYFALHTYSAIVINRNTKSNQDSRR